MTGSSEWEASCADQEVQHITAEGAGAPIGKPTSGLAKVLAVALCNSGSCISGMPTDPQSASIALQMVLLCIVICSIPAAVYHLQV